MAHAVSVVVPVFNAGPYLRQCLDSLTAQTLADMQVICVNDGSTDNSLSVLREYEERFPQVVVVDKENTGYGASMNVGIGRADGEYVGIVEPDDFAERRMFDRLYRLAKKHDLDLVRADYFQYSDAGRTRRGNYDSFRQKRTFDAADQPRVLGTDPSVWSGIYRRDMLEREGVRFLETPGASFQDVGFAYKTWLVARRCMVVHRAYLNYRTDNDNSSVKSSAKVFCVCDEHEGIDDFVAGRLDERMRRLAKAMQQARLGTYRWNYNRLSAEQRPAFVRRVVAGYERVREAGLLDEAFFETQNWAMLAEMMTDPDAFCDAHRGDLPWVF